MNTAPKHFRVFLSSPGDVQDERSLARKVLNNLPAQPLIRRRVTLQVLSWDDPNAETPLYANLTPQAALLRQMTRPAECDIVIVILWSRMGTPLPEDFRKPSGGRYLSGTEWEYEDACSSRKPVVLVYRRMDEPKIGMKDPKKDEKFKQYELVEEFFERFKNADGSLRGGYIEYSTPSDFEHRLDVDIRSVLEELLARSESPELEPVEHPGGPPETSPYRGLRRLTENDAAVFFGRGREVDELIRRLTDGTNALFVIGASGSGKSSLVRAGLLPRLKGNAVHGSKNWICASFAPADFGENPLLSLAAAIVPFLGEARPALQLSNQISTHPESLLNECRAALSGRPEWTRLLIFVDQLEELFTISAPQIRNPFVRVIDALTSCPGIIIIGTMRADFFPDAARWPKLADLIQSGHYLLMPPGLQALSDIVRLPAERAGLTIEDGLLDQIVNEAGFEPGTLPLLAYTLEQLYQSCGASHKLTRGAYEALGGIRGAISKRATESFGRADVIAQEALPKLFSHLLTINDAGIATRRRALLSELVGDATTEQLVALLVEARLLVADQRSSEKTIEIAHEALFEGWHELRQWITENREFLLWRSRLRFWIEEWKRTGRDESGALQGTALEEALQWLKKQSSQLTPEELEFIQWPQSDMFQIRKAIADAREILSSNAGQITPRYRRLWLTSLILAGESREAEAVARDAGFLLSDARLDAVLCLGEAGKYGAAVAIAQMMNGSARGEACTRLAEIAAKAGQLEQALEAIEPIEDEQLYLRALARAAAASGAGRQLLAQVLAHGKASKREAVSYFRDPATIVDAKWEEVVTSAKSVASGPRRVTQLAALASALAADGRTAAAGSIAGQLEVDLRAMAEAGWQGLITVRAVNILASAGLVAQAAQIARLAMAPALVAYAIGALSYSRARVGAFEEALALANEAIDGIRGSDVPGPIPEILTLVSGLFERHGRLEDGRTLTEKILELAIATGNSNGLTNCLARLAQAYALCDKFDEAVAVVGRIPKESWRTAALRSVSLVLVESKKFPAIWALKSKAESAEQRAEILISATDSDMAHIQSDGFDFATEILAAISETRNRRRSYVRALLKAAAFLVSCGRTADLLLAVRDVDTKVDTARLWIAIMEHLAAAKRGDEVANLKDEAIRQIESIDNYDDKARKFARLAGIFAQCGCLQDARRMASRCHLPNERLEALTKILRPRITLDRDPELRHSLSSDNVSVPPRKIETLKKSGAPPEIATSQTLIAKVHTRITRDRHREPTSGSRSDKGSNPPPKIETLRGLMDEAEAARKRGDWKTAKVLLASIRQKMSKKTEAGGPDVHPYIIQQLALATYKADNSVEALKEAHDILSALGPEASNDPETLGLWGAIHKRLWDKTTDRAYLDKAIAAYEKGFSVTADCYNGINVAYVLDLRASVSAGEDAIADRLLAKRIRRQLIPIAEKLLLEEDLKPEQQYWLLATVAEGYCGIGDEVKYQEWIAEANQVAPESWMVDNTREQIERLRALQKAASRAEAV
jgi:hypothetical protein